MQFSLKELGRPAKEAVLSSGTSLRRTDTTWLRSLDLCGTHKLYKQQAACINIVLAKTGLILHLMEMLEKEKPGWFSYVC